MRCVSIACFLDAQACDDFAANLAQRGTSVLSAIPRVWAIIAEVKESAVRYGIYLCIGKGAAVGFVSVVAVGFAVAV